MNKFLKIFGVALIVLGSVVSCFTSIAIASYAGVAVAALGLALTITGVWKEATTKGWKEIVTIACFALGGFLCGFAGISESVMSQLILTIAGLVSLIVGLFVTFNKS